MDQNRLLELVRKGHLYEQLEGAVAGKPNESAAPKPNRGRPRKKSMWTPERRAALSQRMKELALERRKK
jgi:hypothetical protein